MAPDSICDISIPDITVALFYCCCFLSIKQINVFMVSKVMVNILIDCFSVNLYEVANPADFIEHDGILLIPKQIFQINAN